MNPAASLAHLPSLHSQVGPATWLRPLVEAPPLRMRTILIVDDVPEILQLLRRTFSGAGYEVTTAPDGKLAIECLTKPFDVVLADMNMPGMAGCELAKWVAAHWPATQTVLMSGHELPCDDCPNSPRCMFIRKPFRLDEILAAVEQASGKQRDET